MAWIQRDGVQVDAMQFGMGNNVRGQVQKWDRDGAYYIVRVGRQDIRLTTGDWVCFDENKKIIDVQSNGTFMAGHVMDPSVKEPKVAPREAPPTIAMTAEEFAASKAAPKLVADYEELGMPAGEIERPAEPEIKKNKGGRPKGSKNKPKSEGKLPPLPVEGTAATDQLEEV